MKRILIRARSIASRVTREGAALAVIAALVGGAAGSAIQGAVTPVRTEILPISEGCAAFHQAGRDYYDADQDVEQAEGDRREAGAAYYDRIMTGGVENIEEALAVVDETERKLSGAEATKIAAANALLSADNRCLTELDEVRDERS